MPDRYRDDYSSDDERSHAGRSRAGGSNYRTVQRYRVTPNRVEEVIDDRRTSRLDIPRGDRVEVDRRVERYTDIERPRSAIDIRPRSNIIDRYVEREPIRDDRDRTRTVVYEREGPRDSDYSRDRDWERRGDITETRVEKRIERREDRREPYELERYQRETEYYDRPEPAPAPIIIRQPRQEPQQIIVQEAAALAPVIVPIPAPVQEEVQVVRHETQEIVHREPEPRRDDDEYYYRRDVREIGPVRDERELERYDRRDRRYDDRDYRDYSDEDVVVRRKVIKERSGSSSPHHKRHLAEGALAGAGAAALFANHRSKSGNGPQHRGRNVIGGAALGAIGAEVITRARSRYREHQEDRSRSRSRSKSRMRHPVVKGALGLAVAGLAAAAAVKYVKDRKVEKEELARGRSRTRSVSRRDRSGSWSDTEVTTKKVDSKHEDPKHRAATIATAGVATAAVAGVVNHFRNKSKGDRSKSRIRTGAEIAGAGLAGAAVAGLYENRKKKEEEEADEIRAKKERRKSKQRARSAARYSNEDVADPELGMVQYGTEPVYTHQQGAQRGYDDPYDPALATGAGAAYGATRARSRRRRNSSSSSDDRNRSRSRVRDIAGAGLATGAAAIGVHEYKKRKERKAAEREYERRREDPQYSYRQRSMSASSLRSSLTKRLSNLIPR